MRRCVLHLGLFLFAGAMVTIAVAWLLAAFVPIPMYPRTTARAWVAVDGRVWTSGEVRLLGVTDIWWDSADLSYPGIPEGQQLAALIESHDRLARERDTVRALRTPPEFGSVADGASPAPDEIGSDTAYGLPLRCLWFTARADYQGGTLFNDRLMGGYLVKGAPSARGRDYRALPARPIWSGILLNSLLYAALIWLIGRGAARARRRARLRRGRCPWCAYPMGSAPLCAECGNPFPREVPAHGSAISKRATIVRSRGLMSDREAVPTIAPIPAQTTEMDRQPSAAARSCVAGIALGVILIAYGVAVWADPNLIAIDVTEIQGQGLRSLARKVNLLWSRPVATVAGALGVVIASRAIMKKATPIA